MSVITMTPDLRQQQEVTLLVEVLDKQIEADGVVSLTLGSTDGNRLPAWEPGAHIDLILENEMVRQYSLCGPMDYAADQWRIAVLREPSSRGGSRSIHENIERGQRLTVRGPRNNFPLVKAERYLFIAGGIGVTPILPMVRHASALKIPWTLLYGGRTRSSMAFLEELLNLRGGDVVICPEDKVGLLNLELYLRQSEAGTAVYSCGPDPLLRAVKHYCAGRSRVSLHVERFVAEERNISGDESFVIELARSGGHLTVNPHESILDVLESAGYDITNSCRAGICGTCLTDVVKGEPDHRDDVLSDADHKSNKVILPCVSRSRTEVLGLDL